MAADELGLSKVLLVPAASPPQRRRSISHAADRVLATRLANDPRLDVSLVELEREDRPIRSIPWSSCRSATPTSSSS